MCTVPRMHTTQVAVLEDNPGALLLASRVCKIDYKTYIYGRLRGGTQAPLLPLASAPPHALRIAATAAVSLRRMQPNLSALTIVCLITITSHQLLPFVSAP